MKSLHSTTRSTTHAARIVLGTLAAVVLLAATSAAASSAPVTSDQFAPGWQAHAKPLMHMGTRVVGRAKWYVPPMLPRGDYVLVQRDGDKAEVIDGYRFTVKGGNADLYMYLTTDYSNVESLPVADLPAPTAKPVQGASALQ
jgi:hypothetical protein